MIGNQNVIQEGRNMNIGLFFIIFFVILLVAVVWILRSSKSRPLISDELPRGNPSSAHYDPYLDPTHPLFVGRNDD